MKDGQFSKKSARSRIYYFSSFGFFLAQRSGLCPCSENRSTVKGEAGYHACRTSTGTGAALLDRISRGAFYVGTLGAFAGWSSTRGGREGGRSGYKSVDCKFKSVG